MSMMICALCKVQRVAYTKLASAFDNKAEASSSLRRIQRLIAEFIINIDLIAKLILKLILIKGPYSLSMDRTNRKFSSTNINILTLGINLIHEDELLWNTDNLIFHYYQVEKTRSYTPLHSFHPRLPFRKAKAKTRRIWSRLYKVIF